jgi:hypothetical protein
MSEQLGLVITDLEEPPDRVACVTASFRQLLRAHSAVDTVAIWIASGSFNLALRLMLQDRLRNEPSWPSKERWLEGRSGHEFLFQRPVRARVPGVMVWGLRQDNGQWAEPFEASLEFTTARRKPPPAPGRRTRTERVACTPSCFRPCG